MKILHLVFHPDLKHSRANRIWKQQLEESGKVTTTRDMYAEYPDFNIDVAREQEFLLSHDRIVIQFPLYWYSATPLLKKWLDDVLSTNFAYGPVGDKLKGKDLQVIVSVGGRAMFYNGFDMFCTIPDLLRPFQLMANLTQMNYLIPHWMHEADRVDEEVIEAYGRKWLAAIDDPKRSDPHKFLYDQLMSPDGEMAEAI